MKPAASRLSELIKQKALSLGFQLVGIAPAEPLAEMEHLIKWVEMGCAGKMDYMRKDIEKRCDASKFLPDARSVVVCGMSYNRGETKPSLNCRRGWVSQYAWGDDYHQVMRQKLAELLGYIGEVSESPFEARIAVDSSPIAEKAYGRLAGLGWIGKNTCLLNRQYGSKFFLGEIILTLGLDYDNPAKERCCGRCELCVKSCPTGAIFAPCRLDSRLCISYLTIELKGDIPAEMMEKTGDHLFGCDICQDICPWNRKASISQSENFAPRACLKAPDLANFLELCLFSYEEAFRGSPLTRAKKRGLIINTMAAMANSGESRYMPMLAQVASSEENTLSECANWAITRLASRDSGTIALRNKSDENF